MAKPQNARDRTRRATPLIVELRREDVVSGRPNQVISVVASPITASTPKAVRHPDQAVAYPPITGAIAGAIDITSVNSARRAAAWSVVAVSRTMARPSTRPAAAADRLQHPRNDQCDGRGGGGGRETGQR